MRRRRAATTAAKLLALIQDRPGELGEACDSTFELTGGVSSDRGAGISNRAFADAKSSSIRSRPSSVTMLLLSPLNSPPTASERETLANIKNSPRASSATTVEPELRWIDS